MFRRSPRGAGLSMEWKCVASERVGTVPMVVQHGEMVNGNGGETLVDIMVIYH